MKTNIFVPPFGIQKTYIATTNVGNLNKLYDINNPAFLKLNGAGTGSTKELAAKLSQFEAIERVSNTVCSTEVIIDTYKNIKSRCYNMNIFPKIATFENSFNIRFNPDNITGWVDTLNLCDGKTYLVPQSYIFLHSDFTFLGDRVTNPISTGVALHDTYEEAVISGIYEVIERDGIALTWLLKNANYRVNHVFSDVENIFSPSFLGEVNYYDVSTIKGVITICAHAKAYYSNRVKNVLMFASDVNIQNIKNKLSKELISVMSSFAYSSTRIDENIDFTKFTSVDQGGAFMALRENDESFKFFEDIDDFPNKEYDVINFKTRKEELCYLRRLLKDLKYDILVTDISSREAKDKDYKVVKVLIPQLQPISFVYNSRYLDSKRLDYFLTKLGKEVINEMPLAFS